jgi:hypothetical protein
VRIEPGVGEGAGLLVLPELLPLLPDVEVGAGEVPTVPVVSVEALVPEVDEVDVDAEVDVAAVVAPVVVDAVCDGFGLSQPV